MVELSTDAPPHGSPVLTTALQPPPVQTRAHPDTAAIT